VDAFGRVDILVDNTGINPVHGPVSGTDVGVAAKVFDVNVIAALAWTQEARRLGLGSRPGAAIVNVASVAGLRPAPGIGVYGASKAALAVAFPASDDASWITGPTLTLDGGTGLVGGAG
jgi:3-oxoacyl-[acyl-carrier protein] reductase